MKNDEVQTVHHLWGKQSSLFIAASTWKGYMGKLIPWSFEKIRSGEQIQPPTFTNVAAANAAGVTAAKYPGRLIRLSAGGTGSVPCLAFSDGTNWKQIALGANAI